MRPVACFFYIVALITISQSCTSGNDAAIKTETKKKKEPELTGVNTLADTLKINTLLRDGDQQILDNPDSAYDHFQQALRLSASINYYDGKARAHNNTAAYFQQTKAGNKKVIEQLEQSLTNYRITGNQEKVLRAQSLLTNFYFSEGNYEAVIRVKKEYPEIPKNMNRKMGVLWGNLNGEIAKANFMLAQYDSAVFYYNNALKYLEGDTESTVQHIEIYNGLGSVFRMLHAQQKALIYFDQSLDIAYKNKDTANAALTLTNKAVLFFDLKQYPEAKKNSFLALTLSKAISNYSIQSSNERMLATILIDEDKPDEALEHSKQALVLALKTEFSDTRVDAFYILGYNYYSLNRYEQAEHYLLSGLRLAVEKNQRDAFANFYGKLAATSFKLGKYKEAFLYKNEYANIRDSLIGKESAGRIGEIETRYRVAQKDKQLTQNQLQIARQKINIQNQRFWTGGIIAAALVCILLLMLILRRRAHYAQMDQMKATLLGAEQERSRLARELHDGIVSKLSMIKTNFSTLPKNNASLNLDKNFEEAIHQLDQTIGELRTTSHNLLPEILKQAGLAGSVFIYCRKVTEAGQLELDFQLVGQLPDLSDDFQLNIYRLIQEFVNNIIKHAGATTALIQFMVRDHFLEITIDDNGKNTPKENNEPGTGIGLQNLHNRIRLLGGSMEIETDAGTSVYLIFDFSKFMGNN